MKTSPFEPSRIFPSVEESDEEGLLAAGGRLDTDWLIEAYTHGIFPWPYDEKSPILWWSPDPRGILEPEKAHFSRRLLRTCRSHRFQVTLNQAFRKVMTTCAAVHSRKTGTWITPMMIKAYCGLHQSGYAKSVEVWRDSELVGGVYGVSLAGFFAAESMFHLVTDASKVALVRLMEHLVNRHFTLIDIQMVTPHTRQFGGVEIPRKEYLRRLDIALKQRTAFEP
ncbi:MAG: leucyl/phenylalanyl-tRNA--protein transferase [Planctomycetaceae bacterium]|jgi:leucyl/phenylalanyl-tRNA--protein transferase|nr:leucyl/phenylalanyl-tRNA--protein transferase [Planctomycetaceae bacterium]